ncbi:hypothetical protein DPEC_G00287150 [Dallia pectoralis]|uniref:Uncharacterized protein n=1 Tax=Dallia pectoralis TaxID=75939 RepID=A0ACC2FK90_DALPE|nr:hypothetical protein DPEC_G00287150 [Dallia pectoralis]
MESGSSKSHPTDLLQPRIWTVQNPDHLSNYAKGKNQNNRHLENPGVGPTCIEDDSTSGLSLTQLGLAQSYPERAHYDTTEPISANRSSHGALVPPERRCAHWQAGYRA